MPFYQHVDKLSQAIPKTVYLFIYSFEFIPVFCSIVVYNAYFQTIISKQFNWNQFFGANNFQTFVKVYSMQTQR